MRPFTLALGEADFDADATFKCGQVFRWKRQTCGAWAGADGHTVMHLSQSGGKVRGLSNVGVAEVTAFLDLQRGDMTAEFCAGAHELADYMRLSRGVRLLNIEDCVETFCAFLCSANNHMRRIVPMVNFLGGHGVPHEWGTRFPELEAIAALPESVLRAAGFGYRAASIPRACREAIGRGGRTWLKQLAQSPYDEAFVELSSIYGFGPKLTDCVLLYGCGHTGAVPVDTHMWQLVVERVPEFGGETTLSARSYRRVGDWFRNRFGLHAGYAQQRAFAGRLFSIQATTATFVKDSALNRSISAENYKE